MKKLKKILIFAFPIFVLFSLFYVIIRNIFTCQDETFKVTAVHIQQGNLGVYLKKFKKECGRFPTTSEGLEALVKKPSSLNCSSYPGTGFLDRGNVPEDAFENNFVYEKTDKSFILTSKGEDGELGTEDDIIYPWKRR